MVTYVAHRASIYKKLKPCRLQCCRYRQFIEIKATARLRSTVQVAPEVFSVVGWDAVIYNTYQI